MGASPAASVPATMSNVVVQKISKPLSQVHEIERKRMLDC